MTVSNSIIDYTALSDGLLQASNGIKFQKAVVDSPFQLTVDMAMLFLGFICFFLVDEAEEQVYLAGASDTEYYRLSIKDYPFNPKKFRLSLKNKDNDIVKAILSRQVVNNDDWSKIGRPRAQIETVRLNQASSGIASTHIYPLAGKRRGALMYNYFQYADAIGPEQSDFMKRYTKLVSSLLASTD